MYVIFALFGLVGFTVYLVLGVASAQGKNGKAKKQFALSAMCLVLCAIGLYEIGSKPSETKEVDTVEKLTSSPVASNEQIQTKSIEQPASSLADGMTPEQFVDSFNNESKNLGLDMYISQLKIQKGEANVDVFNHQLTDRVGVMGSVNKSDNTLSFAEILLVPDGTDQSLLDVSNAMGILIKVTNADLPFEEVKKITTDSLNAVTEAVVRKTIVKNGIEYKFMKTANGFVFRASESK
ncbi:hypothetical protein [Paenibacillus alvei]|uniref:Uncharacterized protein n=1 Tax=Paenibacillus alvei TaxID=44250 RepID=A0AAP7A556_PAEAL|nr:hypothetical protein [Paenibacillus alvei]NOJ73153.1 hypothetical protein [Paenibacillus alvei]